MLPNDGLLTRQLPKEKEDAVLYVSGAEGVIATTCMVEVFDLPPGESNPKPVCILVELATPSDGYRAKVLLAN